MRRHIASALTSALLITTSLATPAFATFVDANLGLTGVSRACGAWGDYDGDGDLDIFLAGTSTGGRIARVYRNTAGVFAATTGFPATDGVEAASCAWGDFDRDGDLDLAVCGLVTTSTRATRIYRNTNGSFTDIAAGLTGVSDGALAWGDLDNDGDLDLAVCGSIGLTASTIVYRNDGGVFVDIAAGLTGVRSASLAWGDYDGDGDQDLLVAGDVSGTGEVTNLYNNSNGTFTLVNTGLPGAIVCTVAWCDFDNDGDLDLTIAGLLGSPLTRATRIYRNTAGSFTDLGVTLQGVDFAGLAWGDFDTDGLPDLALCGNSGSFGIGVMYHNNGNGTFTDISAGLPGIMNGVLAWGDYDLDGRLDLLAAGFLMGQNVSRVYRNTDATPNAPPSAPTGLAVTADANWVTFSWNAATDIGAAGLTYNLWASGHAAAPFVLAAHSDPPTGFRQIAAFGNTGSRRTHAIRRSAFGDSVYCRVQAVDQALLGSAFTPGSTNVLGVALPRIGPALSIRLAGANPFIGRTHVEYTLARGTTVDLAVHDIAGRRVQQLASGARRAGSHDAAWDGRDAHGGTSPPGVYFVRLAAGGATESLKLLKLE